MKQKTHFQNESVIANLTGKYNDLMQDVVYAIRERLPDNNDKLDLDQDGFEDQSGNDIHEVDQVNVYCHNGMEYNLEELEFWDGIKLIEAINLLKSTTNEKN